MFYDETLQHSRTGTDLVSHQLILSHDLTSGSSDSHCHLRKQPDPPFRLYFCAFQIEDEETIFICLLFLILMFRNLSIITIHPENSTPNTDKHNKRGGSLATQDCCSKSNANVSISDVLVIVLVLINRALHFNNTSNVIQNKK